MLLLLRSLGCLRRSLLREGFLFFLEEKNTEDQNPRVENEPVRAGGQAAELYLEYHEFVKSQKARKCCPEDRKSEECFHDALGMLFYQRDDAEDEDNEVHKESIHAGRLAEN